MHAAAVYANRAAAPQLVGGSAMVRPQPHAANPTCVHHALDSIQQRECMPRTYLLEILHFVSAGSLNPHQGRAICADAARGEGVGVGGWPNEQANGHKCDQRQQRQQQQRRRTTAGALRPAALLRPPPAPPSPPPPPPCPPSMMVFTTRSGHFWLSELRRLPHWDWLCMASMRCHTGSTAPQIRCMCCLRVPHSHTPPCRVTVQLSPAGGGSRRQRKGTDFQHAVVDGTASCHPRHRPAAPAKAYKSNNTLHSLPGTHTAPDVCVHPTHPPTHRGRSGTRSVGTRSSTAPPPARTQREGREGARVAAACMPILGTTGRVGRLARARKACAHTTHTHTL